MKLGATKEKIVKNPRKAEPFRKQQVMEGRGVQVGGFERSGIVVVSHYLLSNIYFSPSAGGKKKKQKKLESVVTQRCWSPKKIRKTKRIVVVLTLTRIIKSVVTGQASVTPELRNTPGKNTNNPRWYTHIPQLTQFMPPPETYKSEIGSPSTMNVPTRPRSGKNNDQNDQ